jgi:hypothetical protein
MWYRIKTAPDHGHPILCCHKSHFQGHSHWVYFVCNALGDKTAKLGYDPPEYWQPIEEPQES